VLPPSPLPATTAGEVVKGAVEDVNVVPLDVKTVTELLLAPVEVACVEVGPEELSAAPVLVDEEEGEEGEGEGEERCDGAADAEAREELGKWPTKNCMLCPVLFGSEHILVRVLASPNATVADAALVQLQYEPGWRVEGLPSCEQTAHSPLLLSQSVRATHGWSMSFLGQVAAS